MTRHFLTLLDLSPEELKALIARASELKEARRQGQHMLWRLLAIRLARAAVGFRKGAQIALRGAHPERRGRDRDKSRLQLRIKLLLRHAVYP